MFEKSTCIYEHMCGIIKQTNVWNLTGGGCYVSEFACEEFSDY